MKSVYYKNIADEKWFKLSLAEQLANICSEVERAEKWQFKDKDIFWKTVSRALELFDLTFQDPRWKIASKKEIGRVRELFCDAIFGGEEYNTSIKDLNSYFLPFMYLTQKRRS